VRVRDGAEVGVRARPGGRILTTVGEDTEFGSPRTLGVVERRGDWLGVVSPELGNGEIGWIPAGAEVVVAHTSISIRIDLSRRELVLRDGGEVLHRVEVAVGAAGSPTPIGRFAVTDKIPGARYGSYYGCCILALSARQASLPEGWTGGDRIAIHGTDTPASIGAASSAGCLRAADDDLRVLMRRVPLGTPVFIHP
jgi:lipoprotein-anchoring transpeptidase ErfK/SrfK